MPKIHFKKILNLQEEAKCEAIKRCWISYYTKKFMNNPGEISVTYAQKLMELEDKIADQEYKDLWWIVVTPRHDVDWTDFKEKCEKACKKKWIQYYKLWFEFGKSGQHIQGNFVLAYSPYHESRVKNEFYNTFKNMVHKTNYGGLHTDNEMKAIFDHFIVIKRGYSRDIEDYENYQQLETKDDDKNILLKLKWYTCLIEDKRDKETKSKYKKYVKKDSGTGLEYRDI